MGGILFLKFFLLIQNVPALREKGEKAFQERKYLLAIEYYQEALRRNPQDFLSLKNLGKTYFAIGEYSLAEKMYEKIQKIGFLGEEEGSFLLKIYLKQKKWKKFEKLLSSLLKKYPFSSSIKLQEARWYLLRGYLVKARNILRKLIQKEPHLYEAYLLLAELEKERKNFSSAYCLLEKAYQIKPENPQYFLLKAKIKLEEILSPYPHWFFQYPFPKEKLIPILSLLEHAYLYSSSYIEANLFLGKLYANLHEKEKALTHFQEVLQINPQHKEAAYWKGYLEEKWGIENYPRFFSSLPDREREIWLLSYEKKLLKSYPPLNPKRIQEAKRHYERGTLLEEYIFPEASWYEYLSSYLLSPEYLRVLEKLFSLSRVEENFWKIGFYLRKLKEKKPSPYKDLYEKWVYEKYKKPPLLLGIEDPEKEKAYIPIFLFYSRKEDPLPAYPDLGELLIERVAFYLKERSYFLPYTASSLKKYQPSYYGNGGYYAVGVLPYLRENLPSDISFFIASSIKKEVGGYRFRIEILGKKGVRLLKRKEFFISSSALARKGALILKSFLEKEIPPEGEVKEISSRGILINLGSFHGVSRERRIYLLKDPSIRFSISWLGTYFSYIYPRKGGDFFRIERGDRVRIGGKEG